jgi:hypothetical protein
MISATPVKATPVDTFMSTFVPHSVIATLSIGFINDLRQNFSVPAGFEKANTTGFAPIYARVEYAGKSHMGYALTVGYDAFYGNYYKIYTGNGREYKRYKMDKVNVYSAGLSLNYHFDKLIHIKKLDVFATAGFLLNNIQHSAFAQGDSTVAFTDRKVAPVLKAGVRYYLSPKASVYADLGYDRHSLFALGFSCLFAKR